MTTYDHLIVNQQQHPAGPPRCPLWLLLLGFVAVLLIAGRVERLEAELAQVRAERSVSR